MMSSATLQNDTLRVVVSAERGEIRSLVHVPSGDELLFQSPWAPLPSRPDLLDPEEWTAAWPGGWTLLFPNAGEPCTVDGRAHGFHGAASLARWDLEPTSDHALVLRWRDSSGLEIRRAIRLRGDRLEVENRVENGSAGAQPYLLVEHLILGERLAAAGARISAGAAEVLRMSDAGQPLGDGEAWPTADDWSTVPDQPFSRFGALRGMCPRRITVEREGLSAAVEWSGLASLWLWHEHRASDGFPDSAPITCLGVEPASTASSQGLARALADGEAEVIAPGDSATTITTVSVRSA